MRTINLRLNRKTNRIVVNTTRNNVRLAVIRRRISLKHSGLRGPQGIQGIQGDKGDKGTSLNWRGLWDPTQQYQSNLDYVDLVLWNGNTYIAIADGTGFEPGSPSADGFWALFTSKGDTGVSTFVRVHHGNNPGIPRPSAVYVEWVGTVAPSNGTVLDTWIDTA